MFRRHRQKRYTKLPFVIFRTILSLSIFAALIFGGYNAFKQFSGLDLIKLDFKKDLPTTAATFLSELLIHQKARVIGTNPGEQDPADRSDQVLKPTKKAPLSFKFLLVADSHNENENLKKALTSPEVAFAIGLGDYTDVGTIAELQAAKKIFDAANLRYFVTAGDHDLWNSRDKGEDPTTNFVKVFGSPFQSFSYKNARFLIIYNSDNYLGVGDSQRNWLNEENARIKKEPGTELVLAFLHEPLYHPSSIRGMGKVEPKLGTQAKEITKLLKDNGVKEIFAGDIHYLTIYTEPDSGMPMTTVGALTVVRNAQNPRYAVVSVYEDGNYDVEDIEVK